MDIALTKYLDIKNSQRVEYTSGILNACYFIYLSVIVGSWTPIKYLIWVRTTLRAEIYELNYI